ncbi:MAG: HlyC/CorC family transporter [Gammaproteobacteria bacterium]
MNARPEKIPSQGWVARLLKRKPPVPADRDQLVELLRNAEHRHLIDPETLVMLEGALNVSQMRVGDIMIPASQMVVIQESADPKDFLSTIIDSGHSRFPLVDEKREQVLGILLAKDLLAYLAGEGKTFDIKDLIRKPVFVPDSKRLDILLREFRTSRNHMAIVVDEYGGIAGLVSIEDVIEQIVGEIDDEHDIDDEDLIRLHRQNRYTVKARTPIEAFNRYFGTEFTDEEYDTVGGLALKAFGHLPTKGESVKHGGFDFTVLRADRRRIHTLRVSRSEEGDAAASPENERLVSPTKAD